MKIRINPLAEARRAVENMRVRAMSGKRRRLQIASLPRIGGLASIPSRAGDLASVLDHILPQVERLHLFLHGYDAIPPEARHSRIVPVLAPRSHPYRASGKFYGLSQETSPCLYFCFDDDIFYPPDYVARMTRALVRHEGNALVGFHAFRYLPPYTSYMRDRQVFPFGKAKFFEAQVDELGSGTVAFVSSRLRFDPSSWKYGDLDDIMLAIEAERADLKRIVLTRPRRYVRGIRRLQTESLWATLLTDESRSTEQMRVLARLMGRLPAETEQPWTPQPLAVVPLPAP